MSDENTRQQATEGQSSGFNQYVENMAKMDAIVREMKEIPELPSERPVDVNVLTKVEFPDKGGVLTYMEKFEYPYKGFPFFEFVEKIDSIKKTQRAILSSLFHSLKRAKWKVIFLPLFFDEIIRSFLYSVYRIIERFRIKPIRYCDAIRELHRAFSIDIPGESASEKETRFIIRDVICMLLEFDNAYRYRFQDIIVELDKDLLKKKPKKALALLFKTLQSRELQQEVNDTWTLATYFLGILLFFNRRFRKQLVAVLSEIDLEKVVLDVADKQFCKERKDYKFGFMSS